MNIRLIAFDLDGTLLNSEKTVSPRTKAALTRAAEHGVVLVPATGRLHRISRRMWPRFLRFDMSSPSTALRSST